MFINSSVGLAQTASRLPDVYPGHYLRDTNPIEHVNNTRNVTPVDTAHPWKTPHQQHHLRYFSCVSVCLCFQWLQLQQLGVRAFGSLPLLAFCAFVFVKQTSQERTTAAAQSCRRTRHTWAAGYFIRPLEVTWPSHSRRDGGIRHQRTTRSKNTRVAQ